MKKHVFISLSFILIFSLMLTACNLPQETDEAAGVNTAVALTVSAKTLESQEGEGGTPAPNPTATQPAAPTETQPPTPTQTPEPTDTPEPTATSLPCNRAEFVTDVTVPDGKDFLMGDNFTKTWRLKNTGSCTWTADYDIVFSGGDKMSAPDAVQVTSGTVEPGETVDVSVNLTAPGSPGDYRGNWKLRDDEGTVFGIENSSSGYFWVEIQIDDPGPSTVYDFHDNAPAAEWITGAGFIGWGGPDTDSDGFAMYKDGELLEDGSSPGKVIETHPEWVNNGVITGRFGNFTVEDGDRFKAKIGFLAFGDGTCGAGDVRFQFNYKAGGTVHNIKNWTDTCDGNLKSVDVDLSSLKGKTVKFVLATLANGPATQDWAVWVNPRIER